jgi:hypothetical protein
MFGFYLMDLLFTNLFFLQISEEGHCCSAGEPFKYVAKHSSEYFLNLTPFLSLTDCYIMANLVV